MIWAVVAGIAVLGGLVIAAAHHWRKTGKETAKLQQMYDAEQRRQYESAIQKEIREKYAPLKDSVPDSWPDK